MRNGYFKIMKSKAISIFIITSPQLVVTMTQLLAPFALLFAGVINICEPPYNAISGGKVDNTKAIQKAISDGSIRRETVMIPSGVFLTTSLFLESHIDVEFVGQLLAVPPPHNWSSISKDKAEITWDYYPKIYDPDTEQFIGGFTHSAIINGGRCIKITKTPYAYGDQCLQWHKLTNITLRGSSLGVHIDGSGQRWWDDCYNNKSAAPWAARQCPDGANFSAQRPKLIHLMHVNDIHINGLNVQNSPFWNIVPQYSSNVLVENCNVYAPSNAPNTDGIDPISVINGTFRYNKISVGDDCMAVYSGSDWQGIVLNKTTHNITIHDTDCLTGHGMAIGSRTAAGISNVLFHNIHHNGTRSGPRIKSCPGRGGWIHDIQFRNITLTDISSAFDITLDYGDKTCGNQTTNSTALPHISNILFSNITSLGGVHSAGEFKGLAYDIITNLTMIDVDLGNAMLKYDCQYVRGVFHNIKNPEIHCNN